jgi:mediator of RNA polymerase II transcription subunit 6
MDSGLLSYIVDLLVLNPTTQANGQLTNENVFDYFATSMFYDKQSNNQVLRMQTMHTGMPIVNEAEELK